MFETVCSIVLRRGFLWTQHTAPYFQTAKSSRQHIRSVLSQPPAQEPDNWPKRIFFSLAATLIAVFIGILTTGFLSRAQASSEPVHYKYFRSIMVYSGDTLSAISGRYMDNHYTSVQDYIDEVCEMNHLQDADDIHAGDYLIIPYYSTDFHWTVPSHFSEIIPLIPAIRHIFSKL